MRFILALAIVLLSSTSPFACGIGPQANVKLDPKDQAVLVSLGKVINAVVLLNGTPVAALFVAPSDTLTLNASDAQTLSQTLGGLRKATACYADRVSMERILQDDTPGIRFLKRIEVCLADACVDNK